MPLTLEEMAETKKVSTLEEMAASPKGRPPLQSIGLATGPVTPQTYIGPAPKPTFWQKWKEYFVSKPEEPRWAGPTDRYEKFYNVVNFPVPTGLKMLGSVVTRVNKFLTEVSPAPEMMRTTATLDPSALKEIPQSMWSARRVFYPVPGAADELKTWGQAMAEDWSCHWPEKSLLGGILLRWMLLLRRLYSVLLPRSGPVVYE